MWKKCYSCRRTLWWETRLARNLLMELSGTFGRMFELAKRRGCSVALVAALMLSVFSRVQILSALLCGNRELLPRVAHLTFPFAALLFCCPPPLALFPQHRKNRTKQ